MKLLKKIDENLERWIMFLLLAGITLVLGIQIVFRFILNNSLTCPRSWPASCSYGARFSASAFACGRASR